MNNIVSGKTDYYTILGYPISHSMSPVIMNSNFIRKDIDKVMLALNADKKDFSSVFAMLDKLNFKGYVFTMPVKEIAVPFMDELSVEASLIGAINCAIKTEEGKLIGFNTDSIGFYNAIQEVNIEKKTLNNYFILGTGGFARAAIAQAAIQGAKEITVTNSFEDIEFIKSFKKFEDRLLATFPNISITLIDWKPEEWKEYLSNADVIANGTPNGMNNVGNLEQIFPYESVSEGTIFFDAIYIPRVTAFLKKAASKGFETVEGINLLVHQGAVSFEKYTGQQVEPAVMKEDILNFWNKKIR